MKQLTDGLGRRAGGGARSLPDAAQVRRQRSPDGAAAARRRRPEPAGDGPRRRRSARHAGRRGSNAKSAHCRRREAGRQSLRGNHDVHDSKGASGWCDRHGRAGGRSRGRSCGSRRRGVGSAAPGGAGDDRRVAPVGRDAEVQGRRHRSAGGAGQERSRLGEDVHGLTGVRVRRTPRRAITSSRGRPRTVLSLDDTVKQQMAELDKSEAEAKKNLAAQPAMLKQILESMEASRKQLQEMVKSPDMQKAFEMRGVDAKKQYAARLAQFDKEHPADPRAGIAIQLHHFLDVCRDVDFGAQLKGTGTQPVVCEPGVRGEELGVEDVLPRRPGARRGRTHPGRGLAQGAGEVAPLSEAPLRAASAPAGRPSRPAGRSRRRRTNAASRRAWRPAPGGS